jgi:DNA-binding response OmpR family regulator
LEREGYQVIWKSSGAAGIEQAKHPAAAPQLIILDVRRLREKVELDPSRPALILTVPGIGYRWVG